MMGLIGKEEELELGTGCVARQGASGAVRG